MNLWDASDEIPESLRTRAMCVYQESRETRVLAHWCLLLSYYPIFSDTAGLIGKISALQDRFSTSWLQARQFEMWGERDTLFHASAKILQTMCSLGVITRVKVGIYTVAPRQRVQGEAEKLIVQTIAGLHLQTYYELADLPSVAQMFPFEFNVSHN